MRPSNLVSLSIALLAVSVSAILIRLCASPPTAIAFWRLLMAGAVFLGWTIVSGAGRPGRHDLILSLVAAFFLAAHFYFWIASLFMTSINSSVVLLAIQPLFALVLQVLLHKSGVTWRNIVSLAGGLGGAAILAGGDFLRGGMAGTGDIYAIISAAMAVAYLFAGSYRRGPLIPYLGAVYTIAGLMLVVVGVVRGDALLAVRPIDWLWFVLLAIFPTLLGHTLLNRATKHFPPYVVNLSILVEPLLTSVLAYFVFSEVPTGNVLLGAAFIVAAVLVEVLGQKERAEPPADVIEA